MIVRMVFLILLAIATNVVGCSERTFRHGDLSYVAKAGYLGIYADESIEYGVPFRYLSRSDNGGGTMRQENAFRLWEDVLEFDRWRLGLNVVSWLGLMLFLGVIYGIAMRRQRRLADEDSEVQKGRRFRWISIAVIVVGLVVATASLHTVLRMRHDKQQATIELWRQQSQIELDDSEIYWNRIGPAYWHYPEDSVTARWLTRYGAVEAMAVDAERLDLIAGFPSMRSLWLTVKRDVPDLTALSSLSKLRYLDVNLPWEYQRSREQSDVHAVDLPAMESVEVLSLDLAGVSVHGLDRQQRLQIVCFNECAVGDEVIDELAKLDALRFVCFHKTRVTQGGVERLRQMHPDCQVAWKPPTWYRPKVFEDWQAQTEEVDQDDEVAEPESREPLRYPLGESTSFIVEPVDTYGDPDYVEALNRQSSTGVSSENNAAVSLMQVIQPPDISTEAWERALASLGMESGQVPSKRFVDLRSYCQMRGVNPDDIYFPEVTDVESFRSIGNQNNHPFLADWVVANEESLGAVREAVACDKFYLPLTVPPRKRESLFNVDIDWVEPLRAIARALVIHASIRLAEGDVDGAIADLLAVHRLGYHLSTHPIAVVNIVSVAISRSAFPGDLAIINSPVSTAEQLASYRKSLAESLVDVELAERVNETDRMLVLDITTKLCSKRMTLGDISSSPRRSGKPLQVENLDCDTLLKEINKGFDEMRAIWSQDTYANRSLAADEIENRIDERMREATSVGGIAASVFDRESRSSFVGAMLFSMLSPPVKAYVEVEHANRIEHDLLIASFAVGEFVRRHDRAPDQWDDLVPAILAAVPIDPYSDEIVEMSTDGGAVRLASSGKDLQWNPTSGTLTAASDGSDLVFSIDVIAK